MKVFIGYECSGVVRRAFAALGHNAISCDIQPSEDGSDDHIIGDVFDVLDGLRMQSWIPDVAIFHPPCTYHNVASAWACLDPNHEKYPDKGGYHQRVLPGTLTGAARRAARALAERELEVIKLLPIRLKVIENPRGTIRTRTSLGPPQDVVQPYEFGHDASKATCLWAFDADGNAIPLQLRRDPATYIAPRMVNGKPRWGNQTDSGQNRESPGDDRAGIRSRTYEGIGAALAALLDGQS